MGRMRPKAAHPATHLRPQPRRRPANRRFFLRPASPVFAAVSPAVEPLSRPSAETRTSGEGRTLRKPGGHAGGTAELAVERRHRSPRPTGGCANDDDRTRTADDAKSPAASPRGRGHTGVHHQSSGAMHGLLGILLAQVAPHCRQYATLSLMQNRQSNARVQRRRGVLWPYIVATDVSVSVTT
jgi:hypothetical protein